MLRVNCAKEDAEFIKGLLSAAGEQGLITRGAFLPAGLQLMESADLVYNILETHAEYMKQVTSIPIGGMSIVMIFLS